MQAEAEAAEMRMKGYIYQQETSRQVGLEAMKNGIVGEGGSALGDIAGLGVTLGAMGGVIGMTRDAMAPVADSLKPPTDTGDSWNCSCGTTGITSRFCPNCGSSKPMPAADRGWTCPTCGKVGITSKFCPYCSEKRPLPATWSCPTCGRTDITTKFCPDCGTKREGE